MKKNNKRSNYSYKEYKEYKNKFYREWYPHSEMELVSYAVWKKRKKKEAKLLKKGKRKVKGIEIVKTKIFDKSFNIRILVILVIFVLVSLVGSVVLSKLMRVGRSDYNGSIAEINTAAEFVEAIERNSKSGATDKRYEIKSDFALSQENINDIRRIKNKIGEEGAWFFGSMDGHGHTITIDAEMTAPLFEQITEGSIIRQLSIVNAHVLGLQAKGEGIAVVTRVNNGTLENILLKNIDITIGKASAAAGLAVFNFGKIVRCVAEISFHVEDKFVTTGDKIDAIWQSRVGAITANNGQGGTMDGAFIFATFTENFAVLSMSQYNKNGDRNLLVGYALGVWKDSTQIKDLYVVDGKYTSTAYDFVELGASRISLINSQTIIKSNYLSWDKDWNFSETGGIPSLAIR